MKFEVCWHEVVMLFVLSYFNRKLSRSAVRFPFFVFIIFCNNSESGNAYVAEWSKALDLRSIVLLYAQVRTLSYAQIMKFCPSDMTVCCFLF